MKIEYDKREATHLKQSDSTIPDLSEIIFPANFAPTDDQIDAMARRLMPEIKRFFADESIQREFEAWKKRRTGKEK